MKPFVFNSTASRMRRATTSIAGLILAAVFSSAVHAGSITHYRMDNLLNPTIGDFLTFSVNDRNMDGIASHDEIFNFSGVSLSCNNCGFSRFTDIGIVDVDLVFGGSGEAFLDLITLNWTYNVINGTDGDRTLPRDFALSVLTPNGDRVGTPQRLFNVGPGGDGAPIWITSRVPEPGVIGLLLLGLGGLLAVRRSKFMA